MSHITSSEETKHIPKFGGELWFVDGGITASGNGRTPNTAFKTILEAHTACSDGDAITIKAGSYTEDVVISKNYVELWFEIGVSLTGTGTCLTVSGDNCRIRGEFNVYPLSAQVGVILSGDGIIITDCIILGTSAAAGIRVTGEVCDLYNIKIAGIAAGGKTFDIQGGKTTIKQCGAAGNTTSCGFYITGAIGLLQDCFSTGNQTCGIYFGSGVNNWTVKQCTSGAGDGRWIDVDNAQMWDGFDFDDEVYHRTDFSVVGGGSGSDNMFKVTGVVEVSYIYADVETVLASDVGNLKIDLYDGSSDDITTAVDVSSAPAESFIVKTEDSGKALKYYSSANANLIEKVDIKKSTFTIQQKATTDTFIRCTWDGNAASGVIHWHCQWEPLTENGFLISA